MEIHDLTQITNISDVFEDKENENHSQTSLKDHSSLLQNAIIPLNHKLSPKPLMGRVRNGEFQLEVGRSEKEGTYGKATVSWEFGEPEKSQPTPPEQTSQDAKKPNEQSDKN